MNDETHKSELVGTSDCPSCGGNATTWWEVPLPGAVDADGNDLPEIYEVSCPQCGHRETW